MKIYALFFFLIFLSFSQNSFAQTFLDVASSDWYYPFVEDLRVRGIVDDGFAFFPERELTRAELAKIVVLSTTGVLDDRFPETPFFPDVKTDQWYFPYITTATLLGVVKGYPDSYFRPEQKVTRAEAVKMVVNSLGIPKKSMLGQFRDYDPTEWFHPYVSTAYEHNIISGKVSDSGQKQMIFAPGEFVTRAEMAKMISQAISVSFFYSSSR
jgi:hypothetical protein